MKEDMKDISHLKFKYEFHFTIRNILFLIISIGLSQADQQCLLNIGQLIQWGKLLDGHNFGQLFGLSLISCIKECMLRTSCKSVNYESRVFACTLNDRSTGSFIGQSDHVFVDNTTLDKNLIGKCSGVHCSIYHKCSMENANCTLSECSDPPISPQVNVHAGYRMLGDHRFYECQAGYSLAEGTDPFLICQQNGQWTDPACIRDCGQPVSLYGAVLSDGNTIVGSVRTYTCKQGYEQIGLLNIECDEGGQWSSPVGSCDFRECLFPNSKLTMTAMTNLTVEVTVNDGRLTLGSQRIYSCPSCLQAKGVASVTCQRDASWTDVDFECVATCTTDAHCSIQVPGPVCTSTGECVCPQYYVLISCECIKDCKSIYDQLKTAGQTPTNRQYELSPHGLLKVNASCDMQNGGWTIFQRRESNSVNFERSFQEYRTFFGDVSSDHWLGLDYVHLLTRTNSDFRLELTTADNRHATYNYHDFSIGNADEKFRLSISSASEHDGDLDTAQLMFINKHTMYFSTVDQDNDLNSIHCGQLYGAFWHRQCCFLCRINSNKSMFVQTNNRKLITILQTALKIRRT